MLIMYWSLTGQLEWCIKQMSKPLVTLSFVGSRSHFKLVQLSSALLYMKNRSLFWQRYLCQQWKNNWQSKIHRYLYLCILLIDVHQQLNNYKNNQLGGNNCMSGVSYFVKRYILYMLDFQFNWYFTHISQLTPRDKGLRKLAMVPSRNTEWIFCRNVWNVFRIHLIGKEKLQCKKHSFPDRGAHV